MNHEKQTAPLFESLKILCSVIQFDPELKLGFDDEPDLEVDADTNVHQGNFRDALLN